MPRVTSKGQVTIPQDIRNRFSFLPGSHVQFLVKGNEVQLVKSRKENMFLKWLGSGKHKKKLDIDRIIDGIRGRVDE
jgi:AbrB family looped-hinge helix DNA binding protein